MESETKENSTKDSTTPDTFITPQANVVDITVCIGVNDTEVDSMEMSKETKQLDAPKDVEATPSFKMPMVISSKLIKTKSVFSQDPKTEKLKVSKNIEEPKEGSFESVKPIEKQLKSSKPPKENPPLLYKEPKWGGIPDKPYSFEVLKSGKIVANIDLSKISYYVFGRLESCNLIFEHPSVSRYHAILQYRAEGDKDHGAGFYVYDLESTHGTFLNKNQLRPRTYYRMRVGHMLKLGGSSRMHILQGPPEDEEEESELSVTEIKALAQKQSEIKFQPEDNEEKPKDSTSTKEAGIDWGFGEDAVDEPIGDNPFMLAAEIIPNEDLYINDPKKTLRGWFEREGYELEYKVEEKGVAHFTCRIELPIDATYCQTYYAEATVKGKKKEAVVACALEACRILDRHGLLRQSQHESRKRKKKNWEDEDFYDSDEDTFLDRTGTIEKKRELRKKMVTNEVETYDSLREKLSNVQKEMDEINKQLQSTTKKASSDNVNQDEDSLEAYMAAISKASDLDKTKKSRLRLQLSNLQRDKMKLEKLINLARPTSLPPLTSTTVGKKTLPMVGSMKGYKPKKTLTKPKIVKPIKVETKEIDSEFLEEEDEEEGEKKEEGSQEKDKEVCESQKDKEKELVVDMDKMEEEEEEEDDDEEEEEEEDDDSKSKETEAGVQEPDKPKIIGPVIPKNVDIPASTLPETSEDNTNPLNRKRNTERMGRRKRAKKGSAGYDPTDPDYAIWLPPENQTGDGKTHLNDKYGY